MPGGAAYVVMSDVRHQPFNQIENIAIKAVALLCLLHTLYQVVRHEFGF